MHENSYSNNLVKYENKGLAAEKSITKQEVIKDLLRPEYNGRKSETSKSSMK